MSISIKLPPALQRACGAQSCEVNGGTVGQCLEDLQVRCPAVKEQMVDRQGRLLGIYGIYLNAEGLRPVDPDTPVCDNDEIIILNLIIGG